MDTFELKREQLKLASKVQLKDTFSKITTIGGAFCVATHNKLIAAVVVLSYPSLELKESQVFLLNEPLPYMPHFVAYREMPAIIEAYNKLEEEPDLLLINGSGILHPRKIGIASHMGLLLNKPTIGVTPTLPCGEVEKGKILLDGDVCGFEITTKQFANALFVSPGHNISLGSVLHYMPQLIKYPHKLPEPLHLAHKLARKKLKEVLGSVFLPNLSI